MTSAKLETLSMHRAEANANSWTPVECVRQLLADLEAGEMECDMLYVAMRRRDGENSQGFPDYAAGGSAIELVGLLAYHMQRLTAKEPG